MPIIAIPIVPTPTNPATERLVYCSDEDIAVETMDYHFLCPRDQLDAYGTDGVIHADDPWGLTSPTVDFARNAVQSSTIVFLSTPEAVWGPDPGEAFAVDTVDPVDPHRITLRRKGRGVGMGDPAGQGVEIAGITFNILSLRSQIIRATDIIDDRFNISAALAAETGQVLRSTDLGRINRLCVYLVLTHQYMSISKGTTTPGAKEVWSEKSKYYQSLFDIDSDGMTVYMSNQEPTRRNRRYGRLWRLN